MYLHMSKKMCTFARNFCVTPLGLKLARLRVRTCRALRFALRSPQKLKIIWGPQ